MTVEQLLALAEMVALQQKLITECTNRLNEIEAHLLTITDMVETVLIQQRGGDAQAARIISNETYQEHLEQVLKRHHAT